MQTTVRTALQLTAGEHVIRVRHAAGGWFTLHPITVSAAQAMAGTASGQSAAVAAELGTALEQSPTPTLLSVTPNPVTIGESLTIAGTVATAIGLTGSAAGTAAAQATPLVLEPTPTPLLTSVSPNPVTIGQLLTISGSADANLAAAGTAAGHAAATATVTVGKALTGTAAGVGGASASGLTVAGGGGANVTDTFDAAITNPPWQLTLGSAALPVASGGAASSPSGARMARRTETFSGSQRVEAEFASPPNGGVVSLYVHLNGTGAALTCYGFRLDRGNYDDGEGGYYQSSEAVRISGGGGASLGELFVADNLWAAQVIQTDTGGGTCSIALTIYSKASGPIGPLSTGWTQRFTQTWTSQDTATVGGGTPGIGVDVGTQVLSFYAWDLP